MVCDSCIKGGWMYLHIHQCTVLCGPCLLQNLKDGHSRMLHDVHLRLTNQNASTSELRGNELLFRPLRVIIGIILKVKSIVCSLVEGTKDSYCWNGNRKSTHLKEHLQFGGIKLISFLDPWISLQKGASGDSPAYPLNGNHFTMGGKESSFTALLHECSLDAWEK